MTSNNRGGNSSSDDAQGGSAQIEEKTRLTEEEKKQNHIMSGSYAMINDLITLTPNPLCIAPRFLLSLCA